MYIYSVIFRYSILGVWELLSHDLNQWLSTWWRDTASPRSAGKSSSPVQPEVKPGSSHPWSWAEIKVGFLAGDPSFWNIQWVLILGTGKQIFFFFNWIMIITLSDCFRIGYLPLSFPTFWLNKVWSICTFTCAYHDAELFALVVRSILCSSHLLHNSGIPWSLLKEKQRIG